MVKENFILLLRHVICGNSPYELPSGEDLDNLYTLAKKHDMAHLLSIAYQEAGLPVADAILKERLVAMWRYEQQRNTLSRIRDALETAQIYFIPLKGSVLRELYPEPWMRTSADIDILVRKEDIERVSALFEKGLGFRHEELCSNEISFHTHNMVHIELHHTLIDAEYSPDISEVLKDVWVKSNPAKNMTYELQMPDEMFYFYHLAHMMKHFSHAGGCGVRAFLDLWLLNHAVCGDKDKRNTMVEEGKIATFAKASQSLAEMWFSGLACPQMEDVEQFVFSGGIYGTRKRKVLINQKKIGGRFRYYMRRIFPPISTMKFNYPVLNKCSWLILFCWGHRWFKMLKPSNYGRAVKELGYNSSSNYIELDRIEVVCKKLGIPLPTK